MLALRGTQGFPPIPDEHYGLLKLYRNFIINSAQIQENRLKLRSSYSFPEKFCTTFPVRESSARMGQNFLEI